MICARCGTEHEEQSGVCPRCHYGKPKEKKPMPKWIPWAALSFVGLFLIVSVISIIVVASRDGDWMDGSWEGADLAISFNCDDDTFLLSNGEQIISGDFSANSDSFTLTAEDGNLYIYRYERINAKKLKLMYTRDGTTKKVTLKRVGDFEEEYTEELEELSPDLE